LNKDDDLEKVGIYMIHPEFEDENVDLILDDHRLVDLEGTARMWILMHEVREQVHRKKLKVGEVEVTEIVGLMTNRP
jgi:hypothetical protein